MAAAGGTQTERPRIAVEALQDFYRRAFEAVDLPVDDAATVARVLVTADVRGIDSHGAPVAHGYARAIRQGQANPRPTIKVVSEMPGTLVLDGDNGLGPVVGDYAMRQAIAKAREVGVGTVTVRNSNHYASCFYYPLLAIEAGMAGMTITTSGALTLPVFGMAPVLGTNPYAIGFPGGNGSPPFLIDMATSAVAMGKVGIYKRQGKTLPEGWTFDANFQPTTDPDQARWLNLLGTDRDHGSHKGYGLNVAGDLFCGLLSGGRYSAQIPLRGEGKLETSHMFTAWRIDAFVPIEEYKERFDEYTAMLRDSPRRDEAQPVLIPGDPEWTEEVVRRRDGIPLHPIIYDDLQSMATELEIPFV
ncbi:MAG TPA: Ldh family oxidoreductase [Thermomicrobiales bacterium]